MNTEDRAPESQSLTATSLHQGPNLETQSQVTNSTFPKPESWRPITKHQLTSLCQVWMEVSGSGNRTKSARRPLNLAVHQSPITTHHLSCSSIPGQTSMVVVAVWHKPLVTHMTLPFTSQHFGGIHLALPSHNLIDGHTFIARMSSQEVCWIWRLIFWPRYHQQLTNRGP